MQQQLKVFKRHLRLAFVVPLLLAVVLGGVFVVQTYYLHASMQAVEHSYQVQIRSRSVLKLVLDMETALRGYLLTGNESFLEPYQISSPQVLPDLDQLSQLTAGDAREQQLIDTMSRTYSDWSQYSRHMIALRKNGEDVNDIALNIQGKRMMDTIRAHRDDLLGTEERRLQQRLTRLQHTLTGTFATAVILSLFFGLVMATFSRRELETVAATFNTALSTAYSRTEELHQNQRWLSTVLGSIADGVIATDIEGKVVFSNAVAQQILGIGEPEISRMRLRDALRVVNEYTREPIADPFEQVIKTERPLVPTDRLSLHRRNGSDLPITLVASPIRDENGHTTGVVMALRDMTEHRMSEQSLQSAEKLANIGRMAATVAHEIHNPLDALGNLLYLVEHGEPLSDSNRTYIRLAREELERVTDISAQMLTFSRETRQPVSVKLSEILDNVLTLYAARIQRQGIIVRKNFEDAGAVVAFPGEMRQVFSNLVGNGLDAMNQGGRLTLRIERSHNWHDDSQLGVRVLVCDTGSGVPPEVRGKLMDPFVTSKGEKGTGLGLWVCRGIVEKHHGQLRYRTSNSPGHSGTCFSVFLPTVHKEVSQDSLARQRAG